MSGQLTPMMQQYMQIKEENPDLILMYRLGDFYEMFFEDAELVSKELNLVLTGRECGLAERAPMCGVPHHSVQTYVGQLVAKGYRVGICEQLEDPKDTKGLVKRGITRIITPGTVVEEDLLKDDENNYIMAIFRSSDYFGISWCDVSTGEFRFQDLLTESELLNEIERLQPREFLLSQDEYDSNIGRIRSSAAAVTPVSAWTYRKDNAKKALQEHFGVSSLQSFDIHTVSGGVQAAGALIRYLHESQRNALGHITALRSVRASSFMTLDAAAIRNLELVRTLMSGSKRGSLLGILDRTCTPAGARKLKSMLLEPLQDKAAIENRHETVGIFADDMELSVGVRGILDEIKDLERVLSRLSYGTTTAADCIILRNALQSIPKLHEHLQTADSTLLRSLRASLHELPELRTFLESAISDNSAGTPGDGTVIRKGYSAELDELTALASDGATRLTRMEQDEREKTGIKGLKIRYNRVFGYFIEVSRSYKGEVPERYVRRQTLANSERYVTEELKALEELLVSAADKRRVLEQDLFNGVRRKLEEHVTALQQIARSLAMLDALQSLAKVARENGYVRPEMTEDGIISIKGARHPVVENMTKDGFVPNDVELGTNDARLMLITGPNMAGKSTYMRQVGIIVLMAHMGSFVPAEHARICMTDRIFTRVGASDDLASGQSTFMVEMNELANILRNATERSLVILDEVGRGTGTADGLAIARAAVIHILNRVHAKTLFATHYHELIPMAEQYKGIVNRSVAVKEAGDAILFLHQIVDGGTSNSFGIEVAKLAGVPAEVTTLAQDFLAAMDYDAEAVMSRAPVEEAKRVDAAVSDTLKEIRGLNPDALSPLEALGYIYRLKEEME